MTEAAENLSACCRLPGSRLRVDGIFLEDSGQGFPIFLGHGLTLDHTLFRAQIVELAKSFRVIAVDFRGHGQSDSKDEPFTLDDLAKDVLKIADHLKIPRFGYAGLSMGAMVGMRLALDSPGRLSALALLDTDAEGERPEVLESYRGMLEHYRQHGTTEEMIQIMLGFFFRPEFAATHRGAVGWIRQRLQTNNRVGSYRASVAVIERDSILARLRKMDVPTLVLVGAEDHVTPPEQGRKIHGAITGASYVEIPQCAHLSTFEQPVRVTEELLSFFKRTRPL